MDNTRKQASTHEPHHPHLVRRSSGVNHAKQGSDSMDSPSMSRMSSRKGSHVTGLKKAASSLADMGYTLHQQLAAGLFSRIFVASYLAPREHIGRVKKKKLAAKVIDADRAPRYMTKKFFLRELEILKKIHHPHIIHIVSLWKLEHSKYLIFMRIAEKGDLCTFIINHGTLKEPLIKKWTRNLTVALMYLHACDIAHRDIKCENILITAKNNVKLADFGFACFTHDSQRRPVFASTDCGSLNYTAPEILIGTPYNPKIADVWSLGVVIYIMLTGQFPFKAKDLTTLYRHQTARDYSFSEKIRSYASKRLLEVLSLLLEPVYHERLTLEDLMHSHWIGVPKGTTGLTIREKNALLHDTVSLRSYL